MKMLHTSYSTYSSIQTTARASSDILTLSESMRIYFTIFFGVGVLMLSYFYLFPQMH